MSNKQTCINFSYHTAKGLRDINEDAYWQGINKSNQILCVLCDGIGSQDDSQIASQITVKEFQDYFSKRRKIYNCKKMFHICLERAYKKITNCSNKDLNGKKIGTTLVVLFINNDQATCFNLGDSRLYHFSLQQNKWDQITKDHNLYNHIMESVETDPSLDKNLLIEKYKNQLHALTRCLESNALVHKKYDTFSFAFEVGDVCFLASDGVYHFINLNDINKIISDQRNSFEKVAQKLVDKALQNKSNDNLTCIIVEKTNACQ